jgi:hypothetical protein
MYEADLCVRAEIHSGSRRVAVHLPRTPWPPKILRRYFEGKPLDVVAERRRDQLTGGGATAIGDGRLPCPAAKRKEP